ncbi:MAG: F-box protein [Chlamydiota bacterium]
MSNNIQFKNLPNEVISNIVGFLDPQSQRCLSQTCKRFNTVIIDAVRAGAKTELKVFKNFIKEKSKASFEHYEKMGDALNKFHRLPRGVLNFIMDYRRDQYAL